MLFDEAFLSMENFMKYLKMYDTTHICAETTLYTESEDLIGTANKTTDLLSPENNIILLKQSIQDIHDAAEEYWKLYCTLEDEESKYILFELLKYRLTLVDGFLINSYSIQTPYFDEEIFSFSNDCVLVDASMDADSHISNFINICPNYKNIYVFTGSMEYYQTCKKAFSQIKNFTLFPSKLGEQKISLNLPNPIIPNAITQLQIEPLDLALSNPISFLRINSNGQEQSVIKGAKKHITHDKPIIAVCGGNMLYNLWQIPNLIKLINPEYKFYIRNYNLSTINGTVIYAIPK